jgi:predicted DNA-binding antitoxin AbrB/MazE fold protein
MRDIIPVDLKEGRKEDVILIHLSKVQNQQQTPVHNILTNDIPLCFV